MEKQPFFRGAPYNFSSFKIIHSARNKACFSVVNFTVEENELYDEALELTPEFLGIIFERLTDKDQGAVYTPRVEVDLMCRLALEKWLEKNAAPFHFNISGR